MKYPCDRCTKEFPQINQLIRHLGRQYICKVAENGQDISQEDLITKYRDMQADIKANILNCPNCGKSFETLAKKHAHIIKCKSRTEEAKTNATIKVDTINAKDNATVNVLLSGDINNHIINNYYASKEPGFITPHILAEFSDELCKMRTTLDLYIFLIGTKWYDEYDESTWLIKNKNIKMEIPFKVYNGTTWVNVVKRTEIRNICYKISDFCDKILSLISTNLTLHNIRKVYNRYKFYINHFCKYRYNCVICTNYYKHKAKNYVDDTCIGDICQICIAYTKHKCINNRVECVYCTRKDNYYQNYMRLSIHVAVACLLELDNMGIRIDPSKTNAEIYMIINGIFHDFTEKKYTYTEHIAIKGETDKDNLEVEEFYKWYNENIDRLLEVSDISPRTLSESLIWLK